MYTKILQSEAPKSLKKIKIIKSFDLVQVIRNKFFLVYNSSKLSGDPSYILMFLIHTHKRKKMKLL